jgi:hypothetical protein
MRQRSGHVILPLFKLRVAIWLHAKRREAGIKQLLASYRKALSTLKAQGLGIEEARLALIANNPTVRERALKALADDRKFREAQLPKTVKL